MLKLKKNNSGAKRIIFMRSLKELMIVFFTNLIHKLFILVHLLHSSAGFEHYYAHLQEDNCINTASGIVTLFE